MATHTQERMCPSAQPGMERASAFAVIGGSASEPRAEYVDRLVPLTPEVLALSAPVEPTEVFRIGAVCAGGSCQHFDGKKCQLAVRLVQILPAVVTAPPACSLRSTCMWWHQEGTAACLRCPQVVTRMYGASETMTDAARPRTQVAAP